MLVHYWMNEATQTKKISEYRAAAAACVKWAESKEVKKATSLRWRKLPDEWTYLADEIERKLNAPEGTKTDD